MPKVSNRPPRVIFSEYHVPKKIKNCAYCKNHDKLYPEKNHKQECLFNNEAHFLTCRPCNQNHKKSINVKSWREKKKGESNGITEFLGIAIDKNLNEAIAIDCEEILGTIESQNKPVQKDVEMEVDVALESQNINQISTELPDINIKDNGLTLAVMPHNYPYNCFSLEDTDALQTHIEDIMDDLPDGCRFPRFSSNINESGYWRVSCMDEYTYHWFMNIISNFMVSVNGSNELIKVLSINDVKKCVVTTVIPADENELNDANKIFNRFHKQNPWLDMSRWNNIIMDSCNEGCKISFEVDPISYKQILDNNCIFNYGSKQLKLNMN